MERVALAIAASAAVPVLFFAVFLAWNQVEDLRDPCMTWGDTSRGLSPPSSGPCSRGVSATSQTKAEGVAWLFLVPGVGLLTSGLALYGGFRGRFVPLAAASVLMFIEGVVMLMGFSLLGFIGCALAGGAYLVAANRVSKKRRSTPMEGPAVPPAVSSEKGGEDAGAGI